MKTTIKEKQKNENAEAGEAGEEKQKRETTREKQWSQRCERDP
jgi:hypothetical protein